jgi:nucleoside-diphosphate-sugar epimerase
MNILVTGAKGFVGKNLVESLKCIRDGKDRTRPSLKIDEIYEYDLDTDPELLESFDFDEVTEEKLNITKEAIKNALANPYIITKSKYEYEGIKTTIMDEMNIDEHIAAVGGERLE